MKTLKMMIVFTTMLVLLGLSVQAHVPYWEDQDFSYEQPFVIPVATDGGPAHVMRSKAIFAYLDNNDHDVYQFTLVPSDFYKPVLDADGAPRFDAQGKMIMQFSPVFISANALPPACLQYKHFYPKTALLGIGLPEPEECLPFDIPAGYGAVVADHPKVKDRPVMTEVGIYWYLPDGLTQHCLYNAPWTCDYTNTISHTVFTPGTYYIVVFNDTGRPGDYTASIGILEGFDPPKTEEQERRLEEVANGSWYRVNCVQPK